MLVAQPPFREFRRALLAYDGSPAAQRAMCALASLAVALELEVDAVELVEENEPTTSLNEAPKFFRDYPEHLSTHHLVGDSPHVILDHVEETKSDLLVIALMPTATPRAPRSDRRPSV